MSPKSIVVVALVVFLAVFAIQNAQEVTIKFLFWGFRTSAVLTILASFVTGFVVGWLVTWANPKKKKDRPDIPR